MKRKEQLTRLDKPGLRALNENLDEAGRGVENSMVRGGAAISTRKLNIVDCGEVTIGTTATAVRHGLGSVPHFAIITMTSAGTFWRDGRMGSQLIYLVADTAGRTAHVMVAG